MRTQVRTQGSTSGRRTGRRWAVRVVGVAAVTVVGLGVAPGAATAAPVNPSDGQLTAAQQAEQDAAAQVGQINAALASAQAAADQAAAAANIALQDYEEKQAAYDEAKLAADAAAAAAAQAQVQLQGGRDEVAEFARNSYMQGSTSSGALALMTSGGPAELLERAALLDAVGEHRVDVVAQLTVLEEQATAADQTAQQTVVQADTLQAEAATLLAGAQEQEASARSQADVLAEQQDQVEAQLAQAQQDLSSLQDLRATAQAFAAQQQATAARAQTAAPVQSPSSSSSSSSSSSTPRPPVAAPVEDTTAGVPSGSAVQTAIAAARSQLGVAYSWGGGGTGGPSYGISPDTDVWGFDCSGLTQYAYGRAGVQIGGTSRDQYYKFRNQTVAKGDIQAGDLLFWDDGSANPNYLDIVHVAIYIGGGQMIEAPDRGLTVRISSARTSSSTYFGAVRPTG